MPHRFRPDSTVSALVFVLWLFNLLLDTGGQLAFKAAAADPNAGDGMARWRHMLARPWLLTGIAFYVVQFLSWIAFLSLLPLSKGVLLGSLNIVTITLGGRWLFRERLTPLHLVGIGLIGLGVTIVGLGE